MKKVLFLQIKGKSYAGVWNVNKLVGEELLEHGYQVHIISIRNNQIDINLEHKQDLIVKTINEKDVWETYHLSDILLELKQMHLFRTIQMILSKIKHHIGLQKDIKKLQHYIFDYNPDYIVTSHYQLLNMIPKKYLYKTIHEQHSSFKESINHKATRKTFDKYNGKIKYLWLTKKTMEDAEQYGLKNNIYIYNAVRIKSKEIANVNKNKKMIAIARLSNQKRFDIMIDIAKEIFKDNKYQDWRLEIYGEGSEEEKLKKQISNHKQIKLMGLTDNPKREFLSSSINLCTSDYEGFALSILEANECGVPTIALNFGESTEEEIINGKTGIIAKDKKDYINKLKELMDNPNKLKELSTNAKEFSNNFQIEQIIKKWIQLFNELNK